MAGGNDSENKQQRPGGVGLGLEPSPNVLVIYKESVYKKFRSLPISLSGPFIWIYFPSPYRAGWTRRRRGPRATAPSQAWPSWDMMSDPRGMHWGREASRGHSG